MSKQRVAVPAMLPGDLNSHASAHFGHCDVFALVDIENGQIVKEEALPNVEHAQGGCLVPVRYLESHGVNAIIAGGMGHRPLIGFQDAGVKVFIGKGRTVKESLEGFLKGELEEMTDRSVCGGGS